jgi:hypothetical protein
MNAPDAPAPDTKRLEELTIRQNREIYAESAGLPFDAKAILAAAEQLGPEYQSLLKFADMRDFALDGLTEAKCTRWNLEIRNAMERNLRCPVKGDEGSVVCWSDWKSAERSTKDPESLRRIFDEFVNRSGPLVELIEARYSVLQRQYAEYGTTPLEVFAHREGTIPADLRRLMTDLGSACCAPFRAALLKMSSAAFGHDDVSIAELHALHNNRMYEPLAPLFDGRDPLAAVHQALGLLGFSTDGIALDCEERPGKYAGAFCLPVQIPGDVRVSVRPASPHHLEDMLFHEYGHAVHFSSIDEGLPFMDRYWIHSGTHETFATLFETLTGLPDFALEVMGFNGSNVRALAEFTRFKFLLTGAWLAAGGAAVCDAWIEQLPWIDVERRLASYVKAFTGLKAPPAWARLDPFVNKLDPYGAGYVLAAVRVSHWLDRLFSEWGDRWWANRRAGDAIRLCMKAGGRVRFRPDWLEPSAFKQRWIGG